MYASNQAIDQNHLSLNNKFPLAVPIALAAAGVGAILLSLYLVNKQILKLADDNQYGVENFEVQDKPYIYGICE